jgi:tetratricopeptide (TPR) repeat protein
MAVQSLIFKFRSFRKKSTMKKTIRVQVTFIGVLIGIIVVGMLSKACKSDLSNTFEAPLFNNLGKFDIPVTATSSYAKRFFTQGVIMANAFNHAEAARSFREAIRQDSTCAMAYWGLAYVLGPNYNTNSDQGDRAEILTAVNKAVRYSQQTKLWEQALIHAIALKFPRDSNTDEEAYASAMRTAYQQFPDNDIIVTLFAESLMNLHAWDLYTRKGGEAKPWTPEIVSVIEHALTLNPENPLANHLYLHATEAAPDVEKALPSAERLKTLVPGAGHLVHMPSHIYINTGDYHEGSLANEAAVKVDSAYIAQCNVQGVYPQLYYPHNWHFLSATAALEGRGSRSIEAAFKTAEIIDRNYLRQGGFETTQHFITIPYNVLVKFSQWEKIIVLPQPDEDLVYPRAIWHYARGMAYANTGKLMEAKRELDSVKALAETEVVKTMLIWEINTTADICAIAIHTLSAEIDRFTGDYAAAETHLLKAIAIEDKLNYNEPPDWFFSVRHWLGDLYLETGKYKEAEGVYREDLTYWVKNGFALNGLYHSLKLQGKTTEAEGVQKQFETAWRNADSILKFSRIDEATRKNLVIRVDETTPNNLVYIAGTFCNK